jgi:hypothetical protein
MIFTLCHGDEYIDNVGAPEKSSERAFVWSQVSRGGGGPIPGAQDEISIFHVCRGYIQPLEEAIALSLCLLLPLPRQPRTSPPSKLALHVLPRLLSAADETGDELEVEPEARQLALCVLCAPARV